jgi:hypothetical protein
MENDARPLKNIAEAAVSFFADLQDESDIPRYIAGADLSDRDICRHFDICVQRLKSMENEGDVKFVDFILKYYKTVPLFRDSYHPTMPLYQHLASQIVEQILAKFPAFSSGNHVATHTATEKEYGHFKPIRDRVAQTLGIEYGLDSYFLYSREDYLRGVLWLERNHPGRISDLSQLQRLLEQFLQKKTTLAGIDTGKPTP